MDEFHFNYGLFFPERTERLHAMLIHCGHANECSTSYRWHGLKRGPHEMVIWQYTLAGRGALRFGDTVREVTPGIAMTLIVPEDHCYYLPEDSDHWEFLYVTAIGSEIVRLAREFRKRAGELAAFDADGDVVRQARAIIRDAAGHRIADRYQASVLAYDFWMRILRASGAPGVSGQAPFMDKVYAYALKHLAEPVSVNDLARVAGRSRGHFSRQFRASAGMGPAEFLRELKIRLAVRLLQTTDKQVKEIAAECGFADPSYFCRVFAQLRGSSPEAYRAAK